MPGSSAAIHGSSRKLCAIERNYHRQRARKTIAPQRLSGKSPATQPQPGHLNRQRLGPTLNQPAWPDRFAHYPPCSKEKRWAALAIGMKTERISLDSIVLTSDVAGFTTRLAGNFTRSHTAQMETPRLYATTISWLDFL